MNEAAIKALDHEFNRHDSTMHVAEYSAQREAILARSPDDAQAAARAANEIAEADERFVTFGTLKKTLSNVAAGMTKFISAPTNARIMKLELNVGDGYAAINRVFDPILERLKAAESKLAVVETRTGALSMIAGRGAAPEKPAELDALQSTQRDLLARLDKSAVTIESLERRASRHAEHLARLETRLKALE